MDINILHFNKVKQKILVDVFFVFVLAYEQLTYRHFV